MKVLHYLRLLASLACAASFAAATATSSFAVDPVRTPAIGHRPNVIVILADDLGYADISAYGLHRIETPHIDSIGDGGVKFTDGYASAPVCGPSRAGLMTGRYQERFGFEFNNGPSKRDFEEGLGLALGEITLGQALKTAGYHTGAIGKWHLGARDEFYPTKRGFDEFVGFIPGQTAYIDPTLPGLHIAPADDVSETAAGKPQAAGNAATAPRPVRGPLSAIVEGADRTVVHNEKQYLTEYWADRAVEFVHRNSASDKPYFLYLAPNAVHAPLVVTDAYYKRFPSIKNERNRIYAAMIAALDDAVGRVLAEVAASGQADNTIVTFMSDNGCAGYFAGMCSCEPLRGGKLSHYEGGVRVPFMMRWPSKIRAHQVDHRIVSLMDIFPTSVAAAGGSLPADRIYDGVDLLPFLAGGDKGQPHDALMWRRRPLVSIRKGDWKLWESVGDPYGNYKLLFNLRDDLNETRNLAKEHPEKVTELESDLAEWAKGLRDPAWPSRPPVTFSVCGTPFTLPI